MRVKIFLALILTFLSFQPFNISVHCKVYGQTFDTHEYLRKRKSTIIVAAND